MEAGGSHEKSLSRLFDDTHEAFTSIMNDDDSINSKEVQDRIGNIIKSLEDLTRGVSVVNMFSKNENYKDMDPSEMKFLLLPYMLGSLWQLNTREGRRQINEISQIYFHDFLQRCKNYDFIKTRDDEIEDEEEETRTPKVLNPAQKRDKKIQRLKESRELDGKIESYRKWVASTKDVDSQTVKLLYISVIKKSINDTEDQLESIAAEMELIQFAEEDKSNGSERPEEPSRPRQPLKPFIITKDATQKKVYGMGYPSLPVMTVEELYEQRRATGEWGPPPANGVVENHEDNSEEAEAAIKDALAEQDDEASIARQRQFDEYKDDHRRGWGNRFNRS